MSFAQPEELDQFLAKNPDIQLLELLMPDINGILRCKRIQRREFAALFNGDFSVPKSVPFLGIRGNLYEGLSQSLVGGDPDQTLRPVSGTLARIPWFDSPVAQVLTGYADRDGAYSWIDPRSTIVSVLERYREDGLSPVVATELEFYLLEDDVEGMSARPQRLTGRIPGTNMKQDGIQYCMPDDLLDCDAFLNEVREACEIQSIPLTAIHSEFSPGQWEINTHHQEDVLEAGNHAMLLRRVVKSVARRHGIAATFMAKPFDDSAGNGLHIHASVYDEGGANVFADGGAVEDAEAPRLMPRLRNAVGGLAETINEGMALFAPNPNSYRRFKAGAFAPSGPSWGYDHREASLRIPVSSESNRRIEHRVAGADANPYLVLAAVLAGIHFGMRTKADPGDPIPREADLSDAEVTLPRRLDTALTLFRNAGNLPEYLGVEYVQAFAALRQGESDDYHGRVTDLDYRWYLRAI